MDARDRARIKALLAGREPEPAGAELAAEVLDGYAITAQDILDGLAEGGTITIRYVDEDGA
jgi:hypothetical protein